MEDKEHYDGGLSLKEVDYIISYMQKNNPVVMEWGMGTSTLKFPQYCKYYYSLEHDVKWYFKIKEQINQSPEKYKNLLPYMVAPDKPRTKPTKYEEFKKYIEFVDEFADNKFDLFFADGRARVFCVQRGLPKLKDDGLIFLHDYNGKRPHYEWINDFAQKIGQVDNLGIFKK